MSTELSSINPERIAAAKAIRASGKSLNYQTYLVVYWPDPIGKKVYTVTQYDNRALFGDLADLVPDEFKPMESRLIAKDSGNGDPDEVFIPAFTLSGDVKDQSISFDLSNVDGEVERAYWTIGWGVTVELILWMPDVGIRKPLWLGYTNPVQSTTGPIIKFNASYGFRTNKRLLPNAPFYPRCFNDFPPEYPLLFPDAFSRSQNRCPYDPANGVGLFQSGSTEFQSCDRTVANCEARFGVGLTNLPYTGVDTIQIMNGLPFRQDSRTIDQSKGNSSNLSEPVRVQGGHRIVKQLDIVQVTIQTSKNPQDGSVTLTCVGGEGPIGPLLLAKPSINDTPVDVAQTQYRSGLVRQSPTNFVPLAPVSNFSSRWVLSVVQKGSFAGATASNFDVKAEIQGISNMRIYTDPVTYTLGYSQNPSWFALNSYYDRMWGQGIDINSRFVIQDWIDLAAYYDQIVSGITVNGGHTTITRSTWNGEWRGRQVQDQLHDFFTYRFSAVPLIFEGKVRTFPLDKVTLDQTILVFTDRLDAPYRNILPDGNNVSTSDCGEIPIDSQPNQVEGKFDDQDLDQYAERPLLVEDLDAQKKAGQNAGDNTIFRNKAEHFLTGVTSYAEAVRVLNRLLDLGEFDEGGLVNPVFWTFECSLLDALTLHIYKVIQQDSYKLDRMKDKWGFTYFRIQKLEFNGLRVKVRAQAYPENYYAILEDNTQPLPRGGGSPLITPPNAGGGPGGRVRQPVIINPLITDDGIQFELLAA